MRQRISAPARLFAILFSLLALAAGCPPEEPTAAEEPEERLVAPAAAKQEVAPDAEAEPDEGEPALEPDAEAEPDEGEPALEPDAEAEPDEGDDAETDEKLEADAAAEADETTEADDADDAPREVSGMDELVTCLREAGVTIYGAVTCPFCTQLADKFGGADVVRPIYVECTQERQRCVDEMIGRGVPEVQIRGEMYRGPREPADIGLAAGCKLVR